MSPAGSPRRTAEHRRCGRLTGVNRAVLGEVARGHVPPEQMLAPYLMVLVTPPVIDSWAVLAADLKRRGKHPPQNDIWIGATALARGCPAVSCDRHFDDFIGVEHIHLPRH
jgi:predicted nucleic acid-binding protein